MDQPSFFLILFPLSSCRDKDIPMFPAIAGVESGADLGTGTETWING